MDIVTVARFSNTTDVQITKGRLETDGIQCFVTDERIEITHPIQERTIKLNVRANDEEAALSLLAEYGYRERPPLSNLDLQMLFFKKNRFWWIALFGVAMLALYLISASTS